MNFKSITKIRKKFLKSSPTNAPLDEREMHKEWIRYYVKLNYNLHEIVLLTTPLFIYKFPDFLDNGEKYQITIKYIQMLYKEVCHEVF